MTSESVAPNTHRLEETAVPQYPSMDKLPLFPWGSRYDQQLKHNQVLISLPFRELSLSHQAELTALGWVNQIQKSSQLPQQNQKNK